MIFIEQADARTLPLEDESVDCVADARGAVACGICGKSARGWAARGWTFRSPCDGHRACSSRRNGRIGHRLALVPTGGPCWRTRARTVFGRGHAPIAGSGRRPVRFRSSPSTPGSWPSACRGLERPLFYRQSNSAGSFQQHQVATHQWGTPSSSRAWRRSCERDALASAHRLGGSPASACGSGGTASPCAAQRPRNRRTSEYCSLDVTRKPREVQPDCTSSAPFGYPRAPRKASTWPGVA